jgi:hypothetical protein
LRVSRQIDSDRPNFLFACELAGTGHFGENIDKPATWPTRFPAAPFGHNNGRGGIGPSAVKLMRRTLARFAGIL